VLTGAVQYRECCDVLTGAVQFIEFCELFGNCKLFKKGSIPWCSLVVYLRTNIPYEGAESHTPTFKHTGCRNKILSTEVIFLLVSCKFRG
jgi:hypothetical protein